MKEIKGILEEWNPHPKEKGHTHTQTKITLWNHSWKSVFLLAPLLGSHASAAAHIKKITHTPTNTSRCSRIFMMCFQSGLDSPLIYFWLSFTSFCWGPWDGWQCCSTNLENLRMVNNCGKSLKLSLINKSFVHKPQNSQTWRNWLSSEPELEHHRCSW